MIFFTKNLLTDHVKITHTKNIKSLVQSFSVSRTHNSGDLEIIAVYEGDKTLWIELMNNYDFIRVRGTWYKYEEDMKFLEFSTGNQFINEPTLKTKLNKHLYKEQCKLLKYKTPR